MSVSIELLTNESVMQAIKYVLGGFRLQPGDVTAARVLVD
jgi:hypothetical protein